MADASDAKSPATGGGGDSPPRLTADPGPRPEGWVAPIGHAEALAAQTATGDDWCAEHDLSGCRDHDLAREWEATAELAKRTFRGAKAVNRGLLGAGSPLQKLLIDLPPRMARVWRRGETCGFAPRRGAPPRRRARRAAGDTDTWRDWPAGRQDGRQGRAAGHDKTHGG
eukprot:gene7531-23545_t